MVSMELFSGCGGLALGTARAGFRHCLMVEWNGDACSTLAHNKARGVEHVKGWPFQQADVRAIDWAAILGGRKINLVAGGPPCQPFSIGGRHKGDVDARDMWPEAIRAVREASPDAFLFENVRGLVRPAFSDYLLWITTHLSRPSMPRCNGETHVDHLARLQAALTPPEYRVLVVQANAADFGAAQKRHRVFVAGLRGGDGQTMSPPAPTHSRERLLWEQWVTGEYWERHGVKAPSIQPSDSATVARLAKHGVPPPGKAWVTVRDALAGLGEPDGENNHVLQPGARSYPGHTGSPLDEPAKALKAGNHGVPGGENMLVRHDGSVRYFSIREAARLQGLPDDWQFSSSWSESMRQIGNAVPTQLAEAMGRWMAGNIKAEARLAKRASYGS